MRSRGDDEYTLQTSRAPAANDDRRRARSSRTYGATRKAVPSDGMWALHRFKPRCPRGGWMRLHVRPFVGNDAPLIGEPTATRRRSATEGGDERAGTKTG